MIDTPTASLNTLMPAPLPALVLFVIVLLLICTLPRAASAPSMLMPPP